MKNLKIYFTSDVHGFVLPTDYRNHSENPIGLLNIISNFKKDENTLIIDGGDTIQGSPFTTYLSNMDFDNHPLSKIMNIGGFDFITLGNHDFNYGYDYLQKYLDDLNATCLCSNVIDKTSTLPIKPYSIKTLGNGLKVGLVGITTDFIPVWEKPKNLENFTILKTFETIKKYHDELKDKVDLLIGIYHGGFENDLSTGKLLSQTTENVAYKICKELSFDILLTGHQHMEISNQNLFGTHIVQTPNNGTKFGLVNASLCDDNITINSKLVAPTINPNKEGLEILSPIEEKVQAWLDTPIGFLDKPLLPKEHLEMAIEGSSLANFINEVQIELTNADISCTSFANSIKGFNKEVTIRDIVSTYIYPNTIVVLEVTTEILKRALLRCSEYFHLTDGEISISNDFLVPKIEHYNYDYFSNIEYEFDLTTTGLDRVSKVSYKGKEILPNEKFNLVMNNYRASGTGGYDFFKTCPIVAEFQLEMTEILIDYFHKHKHVTTNNKKWLKIIF